MSALTAQDVLRPGPRGLKGWTAALVRTAMPVGFRLLRRFRPIFRFGTTYLVTRHDDVREVFGRDAAFKVPYQANLEVITGGEPFFLGMADTPEYQRQLAAMRRVFRADDLPALARKVEEQANAIVQGSNGRIEVVDQLVRRVTFDVLTAYIGVPPPREGRLEVWATRLFEFQFASSPKDHDLRAQANEIAPAFRAHIDREIARRKAEGSRHDDVMARCLVLQADGAPGYSDTEIRTALLCMIVGGPPQPPMVVPQAMEELLRRPAALAAAGAAARANDDALLHAIVREAMRFDPLAPGLPRQATEDVMVARGTRREKTIPGGATVIAAFSSAMMDERRVPDPRRFDPNRRPHEYIHFGHKLHECFGRHINAATLHLMLKPLLKRSNVRRAPGAEGHLTRNGPFAERLVVQF
ncbi:MAG TPA: cytochrome P450 [Vicinamibacterales bacterium]|nr:cytochrome P450 [Vicinamibacterales bacterium]